MAPRSKTTGGAEGGAPAPSSLARRMRELADRLAGGDAPADLLAKMQTALDDWERKLDAQTSLRLEPEPAAQGKGDAGKGAGEKGGDGKGAGEKGEEGLIHIWCDGSCSPNPGAGGWGAIVERGGEREELSGGAPESTNNIMEMTAAIEALRRTPEGAMVRVTTDSQYVKNGITKWIHGWKRKNWRKADGGAVLNQQLWRELDAVASARKVEWAWIKGHSGHPENERCDELAVQARLRQLI